MATLRLGSKIICPIKFVLPNVFSLQILPSTQSQHIIPEDGYYNKIFLNKVTSTIDNNIIPSNIKKDVTILGITGTYELVLPTYRIQYKLDDNRDLKKSNIFIDTYGIRDLSDYVLTYSYYMNSFANSKIIFYDLERISGQGALYNCFYRSTGLTDIYFPSLLPTVFDNYTNQFEKMLSNVSNCTVHFPVTLEYVMKNHTDIQAGFGGTNTTILYDLPGYIRDASTDLVYDSETDSYIPAVNA